MARQRTQADYRRSLNPRDQFGRKWLMWIELATGDPTGAIYPAGWSDPLRTPMQYLRVPRTEDGQAEIGKLRVDFDHWIRDHERAEQAWFQQLHVNARDVYKRLDPSNIAELEKDKFLLDLTGRKPWPSVAVLKRAKAGDKALLGLVPLTAQDRAELGIATVEDMKSVPHADGDATEPVQDDTVVPDTYQAFVSWVFRTGGAHPGDLKRAAELWQEHRKNLQAA